MRKRTKRRDARRLDHTTLEVARMTVAKWMAWYRAEGGAGLASTRGTGRPRTLAAKQEAQLKRLVIGKDPRQLNFGPALWTRRLVGGLGRRGLGGGGPGRP